MVTAMLHQALRTLGHQHWIPRGRDRVIRALANPDTSPPKPFEVEFFGRRYSGRLDNFIDWSVFFYGCYSRSELTFLRSAASAMQMPVVFYDIGANIGQHSLSLSGIVDEIHAFEPFAPVRAEMERKFHVAGVTNAQIHPFALSDKTTSLPFQPPAGPNMGTGSLAHFTGVGETITLDVRRGDEVTAALSPPSLVKIDVEGHEAAVLAGLRETLDRYRPPILMEISGDDRSGFGTEDALRKALYPGARIYELDRRRPRRLTAFHMATAAEIVILPPEFAALDHWVRA